MRYCLFFAVIIGLSAVFSQCKQEPEISVFDISYKNVYALKVAGFKEVAYRWPGSKEIRNKESGIFNKMFGDTLVTFYTDRKEIYSKAITLNNDKTDTLKLFNWLKESGYHRIPDGRDQRLFRFVKLNGPDYSLLIGRVQLNFHMKIQTQPELPVPIDETRRL